mgnify:CR=1 FL=1
MYKFTEKLRKCSLSAEKNIQTTSVAVNQASEDYTIAQVRYTAGVGTNIDVMDAAVALTTARLCPSAQRSMRE